MTYYCVITDMQQDHSSITNENLLGMTSNEYLYLIIQTDVDSAVVTSLSLSICTPSPGY